MPLPQTMSLLVLGQGTSGTDVVRWALAHPERVSQVTLYGGAKSSPTPETLEFEAAGVTCVYATEEVAGSYDVCVASPGISEFSPFFASASAHAIQIMGEPEFSYRLSPERWIGITGTNGKTTTTALTAHLLESAGMDADAVGNIGDTPVSRIDHRAPGSWFVAELSSYQLATSSELHPHAAVLLNITPDHLSWHRSHEAYARAKCRMFRNMGKDDLAVINVEDEGVCDVRAIIDDGSRRVLELGLADSGARDAAFVRDGMLTVRLAGTETPLVTIDELKIAGAHNVLNALAAASLALFCGADAASISSGLRDFGALPHRIEPVGEVRGVRFYNDSKATNTDAVEKALTAFPADRVVLLAGGRDKGTPLEDFARTVMSSTVHAIVCFGEARERFLEAFRDAEGSSEVDLAEADGLIDAVDVARTLADAGDVVLLSPACASFDEFSGFEERGDRFRSYVAELAAAEDAR